MASPRWRFYGFGRGIGSNEKVEMTLSVRLGEGYTGLICIFLPCLYLMWGSLEPFVGQPLNPDRLLLMFEWGNCRFVTQHGAFWCISMHVRCLVPEPPGGSGPESSKRHGRME